MRSGNAVGLKTTLVKLSPAHMPKILELNDAVGWSFTAGDIETMFAAGQVFGHASSHHLASAAAVFEIGRKSASVGAVMVHPKYRRLGLGKELMSRIHGLDGFEHRIFRLVATEEGKPLYEAMGYQCVDRLHKMVHMQPSSINPASQTMLRPLGYGELNTLIELDAKAVGGERSALIEARLKQSESHVVAEDASGSITAFAIGADQRGELICGPVVAEEPNLALTLIGHLGRQHKGQIRIDVPEGNQELRRLLREQGFRCQSRPPVMVLGHTDGPLWGTGFNSPVAQMFG